MGLLCTGWKMPQVPKGGTNLVIADLTCTVTQRLRAVTSDSISPPATWGRLRLLELCVDLRCCCSTLDMWEVQNEKKNTKILGICGGVFWTGDILEYVIYINNIPRKRGAGLPACCTLHKVYS